MKQREQAKSFFTQAQSTTGSLKPEMPFTARQAYTDRRTPDPSSVLRCGRYPIPALSEYRMRLSE
jgi:hypothetical protein